MTNNGTTSNLYINCILIATTTQSSTDFNNIYDLFLGRLNSGAYPYWLNGDLDEVRIYDRAINYDEVKALGDCASSFGNIINNYTPVISLSTCNNSIEVESSAEYNIGDTVLIIQMKGSNVDSSNTIAFGDIIDYRNAGNYEFNYINNITGNTIVLANNLTRQYDASLGKVQLVRVPYYTNANITSTLTCLPWDGNKGGILVLNVRDTITLNADIDASGNGFSGAIGVNTNQAGYNCSENNFYYTVNGGDSAAWKGEGISNISLNKILGKGKLANAGGGGNSHNSGGGGGSNGGSGGLGGSQLQLCSGGIYDNGGIGGASLQYNNLANMVITIQQ